MESLRQRAVVHVKGAITSFDRGLKVMNSMISCQEFSIVGTIPSFSRGKGIIGKGKGLPIHKLLQNLGGEGAQQDMAN